MTRHMAASIGWPRLAILALNSIPILGVIGSDWASFDLIFLYWMENLAIGVFVLLRMLVRPYRHALELIFPFLLAPFFAVHFGMFCYVHGTFVVALFAGPGLEDGSDHLLTAALQVLSAPMMLWALIGLVTLQLFDWVRDSVHRGLGADSAKTLMTYPYRRIIVLHVTILCSGFALTSLHEPVIGLVMLVATKTVSDLWHWKRSEQGECNSKKLVLTDERLAEMRERFPEPTIKVNGVERRFESFAALKASREFRLATSLMRLVGGADELRMVNAYLDMKIGEEA